MASLQLHQTATLRYEPNMAGFTEAEVENVKFVQKGTPKSIKFTEPDQVEGMQAGTDRFKCIVKFKSKPDDPEPEKVTYDFDIECIVIIATGPPRMVPISVVVNPPPMPPGA